MGAGRAAFDAAKHPRGAHGHFSTSVLDSVIEGASKLPTRRAGESKEHYTARVRASNKRLRRLTSLRDHAASRQHQQRFPGYLGQPHRPDWYERQPRPATVDGNRVMARVAVPGEGPRSSAGREVVPVRTAPHQRRARYVMGR